MNAVFAGTAREFPWEGARLGVATLVTAAALAVIVAAVDFSKSARSKAPVALPPTSRDWLPSRAAFVSLGWLVCVGWSVLFGGFWGLRPDMGQGGVGMLSITCATYGGAIGAGTALVVRLVLLKLSQGLADRRARSNH